MALDHNPWLDLPAERPYVLLSDKPHVEAFNRVHRDQRDTLLDARLLPEPWIGRLDAPVVLLLLNPGWQEEDLELHRQEAFKRASLDNLAQRHSEWPFHYLDPAFSDSAGGRWWWRCLRQVVETCGREATAHHVLGLEFHGYHSKSYTPVGMTLPSQSFSFAVLRRAIAHGAVVVATRARMPWEIAVPQLGQYELLFGSRNWQRTSVGPGNTSDGGFDAVVEAISQATQSEREPLDS